MHTQLPKTLIQSMPPARATVLNEDLDAILLELLGDLSNTHAVVLGEGALEFMCVRAASTQLHCCSRNALEREGGGRNG